MKKFLLGILFTLSLSYISNYIFFSSNNYNYYDLAFRFNSGIIQGTYIIFPLTGRCSMTNAAYFECDRFQKFINIGD